MYKKYDKLSNLHIICKCEECNSIRFIPRQGIDVDLLSFYQSKKELRKLALKEKYKNQQSLF